MLPVNGEVPIFEQASRSHQIGASGNAADAHAVTGKLAQTGKNAGRIPIDGRAPGTNEHHVETGAATGQGIDRNRNA